MNNHAVRILQVSSADLAGGAEKVAWNLFQEYRRRRFPSWLAVGLKLSCDGDVFSLPNQTRWSSFWHRLTGHPASAGNGGLISAQLARLVETIGDPRRTLEQRFGYEDFNFSGTSQLLQLAPVSPTVLHCHNLHGDYFDLRALSSFSAQIPVVLTLHDSWMLSGHCAHSFDCDRWESGCGSCPDLTIYPAIRRDATAHNWRRKRDIYKNCRFYISTPCHWLRERVERSVLAAAAVDVRVIPYGIDLSIFKPRPKADVRAELGLASDAKIILFSANRGRTSIWKDYATMETAIAKVCRAGETYKLIFLVLGDEGPTEYLGKAEIRLIPFQKDQAIVAGYYQAADIYLHGAHVDTFPNSVLEALATGVPVIATAVGGIPEQVEHGQTGFLVAPRNAEEMAARIVELLREDSLRDKMSAGAVDAACKRFSLARQVDDYLNWYEEILNDFNADGF